MGQVRDVHLTAQKRAYQMEAANQDGSRDVTGHVPVDPSEEASHIVDFHLNSLVSQLVGDEEERQQNAQKLQRGSFVAKSMSHGILEITNHLRGPKQLISEYDMALSVEAHATTAN